MGSGRRYPICSPEPEALCPLAGSSRSTPRTSRRCTTPRRAFHVAMTYISGRFVYAASSVHIRSDIASMDMARQPDAFFVLRSLVSGREDLSVATARRDEERSERLC